MDVQDPSVGMPVDAFVQYTNKYRRDKIQSDLQALRKPVAEEKEVEKRKLEAALAQKKQLLEQKKMLLDKQEAMKKRRQEAAAAKMESNTFSAGEMTLDHQTPRPPQPKAEDKSASPQLVTPSHIDAEFSFARSAMSPSAASSTSAADDGDAAGDTNQTTAPRLRSFQLTVVSTDSPSGDGPDGAGIFDGFRRVYVMARSSQTLLDGK